MDTQKYKVEFYIEGSEEDAHILRRCLAQLVSDEFDIRRVFGVEVDEDDGENDGEDAT